jgi:glycosyltransferase involved in cell wall biosynthesis
MPVGYSDRYFRVALGCFLSQTYEGELELVIVDNSNEPIKGLLPDDPRIKYHRCSRMPVGALRNLGTGLASGEVCVTWDEDDFSHPGRVRAQVTRMVESCKLVTGWHNILYYDEATGNAYKYFYEADPNRNHPPYACGTSQMYLKAWWEKHKFPETGVEDQVFSSEAMHAGQLDSCDAGKLCVARAHEGSKCHPKFVGRQFQAVVHDALPKEFYQSIGLEK